MQVSLQITLFPLMQVSVPSLPQDDKAKVFTDLRHSNDLKVQDQ